MDDSTFKTFEHVNCQHVNKSQYSMYPRSYKYFLDFSQLLFANGCVFCQNLTFIKDVQHSVNVPQFLS